ncbi:hypothetical protein ULVI_13840 [Cochleicola gelatinilyticus]|uniref:DUF3667 domain-containing protein n=2 Tax=Cochleicola gelatinilyticus TaxID=1763537 RepID=A0A167F2W0_9FLAO|nr:hypothetical protein ULVI_13840 [Cochleicola gelatinilyticus]
MKGQRLKYANPFRFFLSVSIIYFLLYSVVTYFEDNSPQDEFENIYTGIDDGKKKDLDVGILKIKIDSSTQQQNKIVRNDTLASKNDSTATKTKQTEEYEYDYTYLSEKELQSLSSGERIYERFGIYRGFYERNEIKQAEIALDSLKHPKTAFNKWMYEKVESIERIKENPYGFINYMVQKTPFFLFFCSPILALFLWLLYYRKKRYYMEHLVFLFHIFSFVFLALLIAMIPDLIIGTDILQGLLFLIIGPFYFYKALRNYYQQKRLITIIKFVFLNIFFWISTTIAGLIFLFISAALY